MARVVPNKFPALGIEGNLNRRAAGMFDRMNGIGANEVIIETPDHAASLATMKDRRVEDSLWAFRDRILDLKQDKRFKYILIFKNHGEAAGASLEHPHSQLIALPILPKQVVEELEGAKQYYIYKERCVFCDVIRQELENGIRIVGENEQFVTLAPYAPRFPFETWILPKRHESAFENPSSAMFEDLARALKSLLAKAHNVLENPAYNLVIHTSPVQDPFNEHYHWHIEFMPKLTKTAWASSGEPAFTSIRRRRKKPPSSCVRPAWRLKPQRRPQPPASSFILREDRAASGHSASCGELDDQHDDGRNQQHPQPRSDGVGAYQAENPGHQQDRENKPQHSSPRNRVSASVS